MNQWIVQLSLAGKASDHTLAFLAWIGNQWIPIDQIGGPPHNLRIVQILITQSSGYIALVETI